MFVWLHSEAGEWKSVIIRGSKLCVAVGAIQQHRSCSTCNMYVWKRGSVDGSQLSNRMIPSCVPSSEDYEGYSQTNMVRTTFALTYCHVATQRLCHADKYYRWEYATS